MAHERGGTHAWNRACESVSKNAAARHLPRRAGRGAIAMIPRRSMTATIAGLLLASHTAAAQRPGADPLETATIRVGPVGINPTVVVRDLGVDNNVFNDNSDPKSDFTLTITPRAEVLFRPRRLHVTYTTAVDYVYYRRYASERGTNQLSQVRLDLDLGRIKPFASVGGTNTRERYNQEIDARARHHDRTYAGG